MIQRLVAGWVTGRLRLTQILTQNRKFRYGHSITKGKFRSENPDRTAPNGCFSVPKTLLPILLSSRSGVRVPPGVPNLFGRTEGRERLNATRMSVARELLASDSLIKRVPPGVPSATEHVQ